MQEATQSKAIRKRMGCLYTRYAKRVPLGGEDPYWFPPFYIEFIISFLIGRKRTVNFRNQCLLRHLAADYIIIMSRTLKVRFNLVMSCMTAVLDL